MSEPEAVGDWEESGAGLLPLTGPSEPAPAPKPVKTPSAPTELEYNEAEHGAPRERHRSRKQLATPDDVPRIKELTRKLRETEEKLEKATASGTSLDAPAVSTPAPSSSPAQAAPVEVAPLKSVASAAPWPAVKDAKDDPKPKADDFADWEEYSDARAAWVARQQLREAYAQAIEAHRQREVTTETARLAAQWKVSTAAAEAKYPDFKEVAYGPTQIPQGSIIDAWILEHRSGADVLYHLQKNPADLQRLVGLPMLDQVEELSLLSQRLSPARSPDGTTGASAAPVSVQSVPRPPTPVRTGPMRTGDELPGDDDSLEAHEQAFYKDTRRRRA